MPSKKKPARKRQRPIVRAPRRESMSLVLRHQAMPAEIVTPHELTRRDDEPVLPTVLGEQPMLQLAAFSRLVFTAEERRILEEPVDESKVEVLPSGEVYMTHTQYTRLFNRTFGAGSWALVPAALPAEKHKVVSQKFVLMVRGLPACEADGEMEYYENNRRMSYSTAMEATRGIALRRLGKRLGVWLELWDKRWTRRWLAAHAIEVSVQQRDKSWQWQWRRSDDPPFPYEGRRGGSAQEQRGGQRREEDAIDTTAVPQRGAGEEMPGERQAYDRSQDARKISEGQQKRMFAIMKSQGVTKEQLRTHIASRPQFAYIKSSEDIERRHYDVIVGWIEGQGSGR